MKYHLQSRTLTIVILVLVIFAVAGVLVHISGDNSLSNPTTVSGAVETGKVYSAGAIIGNKGLFPLTIQNITLEGSANVKVLNVLVTSGPHLFGFEEGYPNWSGVQNAIGARLLPEKEVSLGFAVRASEPGKYTLNRLVIEYTYLGLPYRKVIEWGGVTLCARSAGEPVSPCK